MAKKRVHEIAAALELPTKEVIEKLQAAGLSVKAAASAVDENEARRILTGGNGSTPAAARASEPPPRLPPPPPRVPPPVRRRPEAKAAEPAPAEARKGEAPKGEGAKPPADGPRARPTRDSLQGERAPAAATGGGRRRVVIDSQASRRPASGGTGPAGAPPRGRRPGRGRGRRGRRAYEEEAAAALAEAPRIEERKDLIRIPSGSTVKDVAEHLAVPVPEVIKRLMKLGEMATLTQTLSDDTVLVLAEDLDRYVEVVHAADDPTDMPIFDDLEADLVERPPVVTIMGHVDHGKTSLLDAIRETEVVKGEAGGITQHIGAYQVHHGERAITFLDTPGHEAFTAMRARGAQVTDIAIIVVAADDGVKPQTEEAIDHAKAAGVPVLVAVNKIDKEGAAPDRVRSEMAAKGLQPVEWGGETEFVDVSAKTREGLDDLLETLLVMAEVQELKANPNTEASGTVIESKLDPGRGPVATVLISRGTLNIGDALVAGASFARVRAMQDYLGQKVDIVGPGLPVEVLGFDSVPEAGEAVFAVESDRIARDMARDRAHRLKTEGMARRRRRRMSLEEIFDLGVRDLNLVLKADVAGSLEAIQDEIARLPQDEVAVSIVRSAVGGITESDVDLAAATDAVILGFNVRPVGDARAEADRQGVEIRSYSVIYRALEDLRAALEGMLEPEQVEDSLGRAQVRQIFKASKVGTIAGCYVLEGKITRGAKARLVRDGTVVYETQIASLRRFNEDVREVASGYECGIVLRDYSDVKDGDEIEAYATREVERELAAS